MLPTGTSTKHGCPIPGTGLDDRPHFEVLGERYKNNDPEPEEEIWMPVKVPPLKPTLMPLSYSNLIQKAYAAFNARDIRTALSTMHPEVEWPKAFEGGYVSGHHAVREYWNRQWLEINPVVMPVGFKERADGNLAVTVHQKVTDLEGNTLFDGEVKHIYTLQDGLFRRMDIES